MVNYAYSEAKRILTQYKDNLVDIAEKLIEVETLNKDEFEKIFPSPVKKTGGVPVKNGAVSEA